MDSKELLHILFHSAPSAVFAFVAGCWDAHPLLTLVALAALAYGLYCTVRTVSSRPLTLLYLVYGVLSGAAAMRFAMGLIGLDSSSDAAASALIGAGVGAIVGFCTMLGRGGVEKRPFPADLPSHAHRRRAHRDLHLFRGRGRARAAR